MRRFVASGQVPGIIAFVDGQPAGWCSISPKTPLVGLTKLGEPYGTFTDSAEWAVICFYVPEKHRGIGLMSGLLEAAVQYAAAQGASRVEGYPMDAGWDTDGAGGTRKAFDRAGFIESRRIGDHQSLMLWRPT
jgi:GNAT superfamily N-acetyltransferase